MSVQVAKSHDSTVSTPLCDFCGKNQWAVRHRVDCEGDHIYLDCAVCEIGSFIISIGTQVEIL